MSFKLTILTMEMCESSLRVAVYEYRLIRTRAQCPPRMDVELESAFATEMKSLANVLLFSERSAVVVSRCLFRYVNHHTLEYLWACARELIALYMCRVVSNTVVPGNTPGFWLAYTRVTTNIYTLDIYTTDVGGIR